MWTYIVLLFPTINYKEINTFLLKSLGKSARMVFNLRCETNLLTAKYKSLGTRCELAIRNILKTRFPYKKGGPGGFTRSVVIQPSSSQHLIFRFIDFLLVAHSTKFKMKYLSSKFHYLLISFRLMTGGCKKNNNNIYRNNDIRIINIALRSYKFLMLY